MALSGGQERYENLMDIPSVIGTSTIGERAASTVSTSPPGLGQSIPTPSSGSRTKLSASSGRSRRGCQTCRKRKVKCNEERPVCGHCHRLQLSCNYDQLSARSPDASRKRQKQNRDSSQQDSALWQALTLSGTQARSQAIEGRRSVNPSRAQSVSNDPLPLQQYNPSSNGNLMPQMNFDVPIIGQTTDQQLLNTNSWELELLGEDSLWANIPILSNFISVQDSPPYEYVASYDIPQALKYPNLSNSTQLPNPMPVNGTEVVSAPVTSQHSADQNAFVPIDEITLLRHFVDFAVPPILVGVEPRWNTSRDALLRLSKSSLPLRHAICAFSALSLGEASSVRTSSASQSSSFYSGIAMKELNKILNEQSLVQAPLESYESILASVFFLSYVELIVSKVPKSSVDLLDKAHALLSNHAPPNSSLYNQLQIWLKLLDAKVVSAGGKGIHLHTNPNARDLEVFRENYDSSVENIDQTDSKDRNVSRPEVEDILFNSLNRQAYNFYIQVLDFSGRIARLDKWHRSRGSVQDEMEVMLAADKIVRDLNALWTRRPAIIDLADQSDQLRQYMAASLATKVEHHLRTYTANFYACFIHLQRVAYAHLKAIEQVDGAVAKIVGLSRMMVEEGHALPVSMLWPLMMAACEAKEEETQGWIIGSIEGMSKVGNAMKTARLVREIVGRQKSGQRADARTVMHEAFGEVFAII